MEPGKSVHYKGVFTNQGCSLGFTVLILAEVNKAHATNITFLPFISLFCLLVVGSRSSVRKDSMQFSRTSCIATTSKSRSGG